jgi:hypothetical protein
MTIAAGFVVHDGVLICSDSEHSAGGLVTHNSKLTPVDFSSGKVVFASAGNTELALAAIQKCSREIQSKPVDQIRSNADVANIIESTVNTEYRKHVANNPDPAAPSVYEILAAVWSDRDSTHQASLFKTWQGVINSVEGYHCIGSGYYLGNYVIESMAGWALSGGADVEKVRVVATYTLAIAKKFVDGCGGNSHIAFLRNDGTVIGSTATAAEPLEEALHDFNRNATELLFSTLTASDVNFAKGVSDFCEAISKLRLDFKFDDKGKEALKTDLAKLRATLAPGSTTVGP